MSELITQPIESLADFLAHSLELEVESAERYRELADSMEVHNNLEVAALFDQLAHYGDIHAEQVRRRATGLELPSIAPWDFKWHCPDSPEAPCMDDANYLMNKCQALELALHNEARGRDFYRQVAETSPNAEVRTAAAEMAEEEEGHLRMLEERFRHEACDIVEAAEDLDPPHMPE